MVGTKVSVLEKSDKEKKTVNGWLGQKIICGYGHCSLCGCPHFGGSGQYCSHCSHSWYDHWSGGI